MTTSTAADAATGPVPPPGSASALPPSVGAFHYTRYKPWTPPLAQGGAEPGRHPVVIAGGGPVGMALALGLANHGVRCVVLEADDTACVGSRVTSSPPSVIVPRDLGTSPMRARIVVVLPTPFRPSTAVTPSAGTSNEIPCRTCDSPR